MLQKWTPGLKKFRTRFFKTAISKSDFPTIANQAFPKRTTNKIWSQKIGKKIDFQKNIFLDGMVTKTEILVKK